MRDLIMIGIALAFTGLLVLLRSLLVGLHEEKLYRISVMNFSGGDDGDLSSGAVDEWPSVIGVEDDSSAEKGSLWKNSASSSL